MKKNILISVFATVMTALNSYSQEIFDYTKNPYGLVYRNAITENGPGQVNIHPVTYELNGNKISANVYTPANYNPAKKYAAVVVSHPNGGVKEQTAGLYAQRLAQQGYVTIAADASYQGASGGEPRNLDIPQNRINDVRGMVDYISKYPGVDADRIGALGICGGGGYTFAALQSDKRIKAGATLSLFNTGRVRTNGYQDSQMSTIQDRLKRASEAREHYVLTGESLYEGSDRQQTREEIIEAMSKLEPGTLYHDGLEYYSLTHRHPNSVSRYTTASLMDLMTWDATAYANLIDCPLLIMSGSKSDSDYMSREAYEKAGTADKEYFIIDGASHIQTYYIPEYVDAVVNKLTDFYENKLK
ncbi:alpha/beta hydrolase [Heminiphilus faecis]|uniref:Alpha/beta hydrolase n=2 Tax=Bacteroidales TaxID=171549 RepID=A0ABV4CYD0_9BACT